MNRTGTILLALPDELISVDVLTGKSKSLYRSSEEWTIHGCAGPNRHGLIVFTENDMGAKRHRFMVLEPTESKPRILFDRPGDALWDHAISEEIAIADEVDVAVFSSGDGNLQLYDPQAYMRLGKLELVDLKTGKISELTQTVFQGSLAIDPFGKKVFAIAGYDRAAARRLPKARAEVRINEGSDQQPIAIEIDVTTRKAVPLIAARNVLPKLNDRVLVFSDYDDNLFTFDLQARKVTPVSRPEYLVHVLAFQPPSKFIGTAKQARLGDVQMTENNGLPGPRPMGRVVSIDTAKNLIADLYPTIDPRTPYSYSVWSLSKSVTSKP